jgi:alkylhydroperoxidase family enzyme
VDFGYWLSVEDGLDPRKVQDVPRWRDSPVFTPLERDVLEYAEAMSQTPPSVDDALVQALRTELSEAQLVELTMMIAVENQRSRFNAALGLTSQGFKDRCEIPA